MRTSSTAKPRAATKAGCSFPGDEQPEYWDFVYFSFVIGMTFQVSDVQVTSKSLRRLVVAHGVVSFFYNVAVLALMVNIGGEFIKGLSDARARASRRASQLESAASTSMRRTRRSGRSRPESRSPRR